MRGLFFRRTFARDDQISLRLSNLDPSDDSCGIVDGYTFHIIPRDGREPAGYVSLRMGESPSLYYLGHIGYRVEEAYRGRGYAARACGLLIPFFRELGFHSLVITTDIDNWPSRKTCEKLGCVLERVAPVPPDYQYLVSGSTRKCRYILLLE